MAHCAIASQWSPPVSHPVSRRRFLALAAVTAAAPLALKLLPAEAAEALPKLSPDNPQAKALAYTEDAKTVKHPTYKPGSACANCNFFKAPPTQEYGPCMLFPKNSVAAKGWCSAWVKKA